MTHQSQGPGYTPDARAMISARRPAGVGKIEKARDPRRALLGLVRYLGPFKAGLIFVLVCVIIYTLLGLAGPYLMGVAIDDYITPKKPAGLAVIALVMLVVYLFNQLFVAVSAWVMSNISQRALKHMRRDLFTHLQTLPLAFFDRNPAGELMSRLTNDIEAINQAVSQNVTSLLASVLGMVGIVVAMFILDKYLALATLLVIPIMFWFTQFVARYTRRGFRDLQKHLGELNGVMEESISGQKVITAFRRNETVVETFRARNQEVFRAGVYANSYALLLMPLTNVLGNFFVIVLVALGGLLALRGLVTVGVIATFISYAQNFINPLRQLANMYNSIQGALAGAERVFQVIDTPSEIDAVLALSAPAVAGNGAGHDGAGERAVGAPIAGADGAGEDGAARDGRLPLALPAEPGHNGANGAIRGDVCFDHVTFSYEPGQPVIKDMSLEAKAGEMIALVGPTGAGKTTIINLLTRFYEIDAGRIAIDGEDIRDIPKGHLRRQLGLVLQDTFLFSGSVMDNIRYGRLDATDDEVIAAAEMADADHFIRQLPQGYETLLSERAGNLSQGQRQLLAIARAILADPRILILDEATSSVDTRTEARIQKSLLRLMQGRTSFVIAHRLSTIRDATRVLVIDDGQIVEQGSHRELLAARGFYYHLYVSQFKGQQI